MKKISYNKLIRGLKDGRLEVESWEGTTDHARVRMLEGINKGKVFLFEVIDVPTEPKLKRMQSYYGNPSNSFKIKVGNQGTLKFTKEGSKWIETLVSGDLYGAGGKTYGSYLTPQDILQWIRQDYGRHEEDIHIIGRNPTGSGYKMLIKEATVGLIGDHVRTITLEKLYVRVKDKCSKYGVYAPSWANFVGLTQELYTVKGNTVHLPSPSPIAFLEMGPEPGDKSEKSSPAGWVNPKPELFRKSVRASMTKEGGSYIDAEGKRYSVAAKREFRPPQERNYIYRKLREMGQSRDSANRLRDFTYPKLEWALGMKRGTFPRFKQVYPKEYAALTANPLLHTIEDVKEALSSFPNGIYRVMDDKSGKVISFSVYNHTVSTMKSKNPIGASLIAEAIVGGIGFGVGRHISNQALSSKK